MIVFKYIILITYILIYKLIENLKNRILSFRLKQGLIVSLIVLVIFIMISATIGYRAIYNSNTNFSDSSVELFLKKNISYKNIIALLKSKRVVKSFKTFEIVSNLKKYPSSIKSGRYIIKKGMSNNEIINTLRSGNQTTINVIINNVRTTAELAGELSKQTMCDSLSYINYFNSKKFLKKYKLTKETALTHFIPNTYNMFWNTTPQKLAKSMNREKKRFWLIRKKSLKALKMTPKDVYILASIVGKESHEKEDRKKIAGVYINRLKRGMRLQADPTIVFALGDFAKKRVLTKDTQFDSPYNTYKYKGLPPGPISISSPATIDAVLNYSKHKYLYFSADPENIGLHLFARNLIEHNKNARKYHQMLNRRRIYK